jgi:chromosome segregation ATPase
VIKKENRKLERMESEIAEGEATLARDGQREEVRANIQAAQHAHDEADANYKESVNKSDGKKQEQDACERELDILEGQLSSMQTRVLDAEERLQQLRQHAHGKGGTAIYGQGIPGVLRLINSTRWVGIKPMGPLGMYVHLKDKKWAKVLRIGLGYLMGSFAVTNMQDCKTLTKILNENGGCVQYSSRGRCADMGHR